MATNKVFNIVFPIGAACSCANTLKGIGLRIMSGPFDWLYGSSFEGRIDLFLNEFDGFLEKEDLVFSYSEASISCDVYKNTRTGISFNHDFISNIPFDTSYNIVKSKYDRRIKRLLSQIDKSNSILFVYIDIPNSFALDINLVIEKHAQIKAKYPDKNIELYYISYSESEDKIEYLSNNAITYIKTNYKNKDPNAPHWHVDFIHLSKYFKDIELEILH